MESMGGLRGEERDNLNKSFYQDVESEGFVDNREIITNSILGNEEPAEEVTDEKLKSFNLDINSFKEEDKEKARSIGKKIEDFLKNSKSGRESFSSQLSKFSIPELILISSSEYYEKYRNAFVGSNLYEAVNGLDEIDDILDDNSFNEKLISILKSRIGNMSKEEIIEFDAKCHAKIKVNKDIEKEIYEKKDFFFLNKSISKDTNGLPFKEMMKSVEDNQKKIREMLRYLTKISSSKFGA